MKFSVLMSIYYKEKASNFNDSLQSLIYQTIQADEVIIVKDGVLTPDLEEIIGRYNHKLNIKCLELEKNVGLGLALQKGILYCQNDIVARMDTDDICHPQRFEKQINFLENHPNIDVVGSWISEFEDNPENIYTYRELPTKHENLINFAKKRNPLNHMTVMYRRQAVLNAGNYQSLIGFEDYYLWARMLMNGSKFANINEYLVNARAGKSLINRRGGLQYCINEISLQKKFLSMGFIKIQEFVRNIIMRATIFIMPNIFRRIVYNYLLRKNT